MLAVLESLRLCRVASPECPGLREPSHPVRHNPDVGIMGEFAKALWLRIWRRPIVDPMRLKSSIWVAAYLRRCQTEGIFGAVRRRGAEEAGAVFVKVALLDGNAMLYVPAPQTVYDDSRPIERIFTPTSREPVPEASVEERLAKEIRFDPDAWIIETEDRAGRHFLDLARA